MVAGRFMPINVSPGVLVLTDGRIYRGFSFFFVAPYPSPAGLGMLSDHLRCLDCLGIPSRAPPIAAASRADDGGLEVS